ncbi:hypothetical protein CCYA_CCYA02G0487 [Cyanidiococcus yangmingshanensis]|nr:hypothetical protein CCYA_CCYA02G0487 [Cyanidiococcus yangmingshanensis]
MKIRDGLLSVSPQTCFQVLFPDSVQTNRSGGLTARGSRPKSLLSSSTVVQRAKWSMETRSSPASRRVLVTGAAGFIGFHAVQRLAARGDTVTALDNFNSYYDPKLKRDRIQCLINQYPQVRIVERDLMDEQALDALFSEHKFTHVLHLAAQAGVRHSLTHPHDYLRSNCVGFLNILECIRHQQPGPPVMVYASSSSVYGLGSQVPFHESMRVDSPASLYAATKRADELMAFTYHHLYGIHVTGLRYFTVYGPWGRPDMAYYSFAKAMQAGRPIVLYRSGSTEPARDFTFIDDAIDGTIAALDHAYECEIFNIGNHQMEPLSALVQALEEEFGIVAQKQYGGLQPGDVPVTYADVSKAHDLLGYQPKIGLREGIQRFAEWYRWYHHADRNRLDIGLGI